MNQKIKKKLSNEALFIDLYLMDRVIDQGFHFRFPLEGRGDTWGGKKEKEREKEREPER